MTNLRFSSLIVLILFLFFTTGQAQNEDSIRVKSWLAQRAQFSVQDTALSMRIDFFSKLLLGIPYQEGTLDINPVEQLVTTSTGFDCVTFVESALALALSSYEPNADFQTYKKYLAALRYRQPDSISYGQRNHYFSDWMLLKVQRGQADWVTQTMPNTQALQSIHFMSSNAYKYPLLKKPEELHRIVERENHINESELRYLPQPFLERYQDRFQTGDVIAFVTNVKGLDVSHTAIFYRDNKQRARFYHASTSGQVMLNPASLVDYVKRRKSVIGVMAIRFRKN